MEVESDPRPVAAQQESTAAQTTGCPHRFRWRDMNPIARYFTLERAVPALAAFPLSAFVLYQGAAVARTAAPEGDILPAAAGLMAMAVAALLAAGAVEYFRILRSLHRPNRAVQLLHGSALGALSCGVVYLAPGREWIALALIPGLAVASELRDSRAQLRDRSTCRTDPTLPVDIEEGMRAWTGEWQRRPTPKPTTVDDESWKCPHFLVWREARPWVIAEFFVHRLVYLAYLGGVWMLLLAVLVNASAFETEFLDNPIKVLVLLLGVPSVLNLIAVGEWRSGGTLHRSPIGTYVWCAVAYAVTAVLAGWAAQVLDRPYLWAVAPLSAAAVYLMVWRASLSTDPATCRTEPGLHPRAEARRRT